MNGALMGEILAVSYPRWRWISWTSWAKNIKAVWRVLHNTRKLVWEEAWKGAMTQADCPTVLLPSTTNPMPQFKTCYGLYGDLYVQFKMYPRLLHHYLSGTRWIPDRWCLTSALSLGSFQWSWALESPLLFNCALIFHSHNMHNA